MTEQRTGTIYEGTLKTSFLNEWKQYKSYTEKKPEERKKLIKRSDILSYDRSTDL